MSERQVSAPLQWQSLARTDGVRIEQALARNNSWYLVVPAGDAFELRYASQSANALLSIGPSLDDAKAGAEAHADRYDTRV